MYLISGRGKSASKKKSKTPPDAQRQARIDSEGPSPSIGNIGLDSLDITADYDADAVDDHINDPELLGELEALRAEMGLGAVSPKRPKQKHIAAEADSLVEQPMHIAGFDDDDRALDGVGVTEDDMNDPTLLAELSRVSESPHAQAQATKAKSRAAEATEAAAASALPTPGAGQSDAVAVCLAERQAQLKAAALVAKRAGNMDGAREMLVQMKDVQSALALLQSGQPLPPGFAVPPAPLPSAAPAEPAEAEVDAKAQPQTAAKPQPAAKALPANKPQQKALQAAPIPAPREALDDHVGHGLALEQMATSFAAMKNKLASQAADATRLAAHFLKAGDKPTALEFHRLKKRAVADLATAASYEANGRTLPPPFLHREVRWTAPGEQPRDISASELQISIRRVVSDGDLKATLQGESDFYLQWELGWPKDAGGQKAYTRTVRYREFEESRGELELGYVRNVEFVNRQAVRPLVRWVERGRLTVGLYKYMGLLWGSQLVGRATLPLAELREKAEVAALVEIKAAAATASEAASRLAKPLVGGPVFVDVSVRLRLPLNNTPEPTKYVERWIYIGNQEQPPHAVIGTVPERAAVPSADNQLPLSPPEPPGPAPEPAPALAEHKEAVADAGAPLLLLLLPADDISAHLDSMDTTLSNAVLELELLQIPARIREEARGKEAVAQLRDLEEAIKLRMSVVAAQVGAGTLTIQDYMGGVEAEMAQTKEWALAAKKQDRKDLALRALKRVKAMQNELNEMKAAMENE
ncbi:hypothetical protein LPJ66_006862 [Kickxella alabastrina]|uniref:Uncharacterized protein n=1 Tax=Kickxella alabastrina TaxID=61397 RepID=A0ACC1IEH1_9FUNG|nr:hypothetical protein LPJ66_006862 [Kickxella alabastrina]